MLNYKFTLHVKLQVYWKHLSWSLFSELQQWEICQKYCLNKVLLGAVAQSLSGEHPVWIAADRLPTMSL